MTIDATTRFLLEKYDPTNKALQAPVGASSGEALPLHKQTNKTPPVSSHEVVYKSASGCTGIITVLMESTKYPDEIISKACAEFNRNNPSLMSNSYQLPAGFEGIPAGSWIYITYIDKE